MLSNKDFGKRIQKIMDHYAVSASSFADYMGVGRSSISHILSGRNKPSLDFVMKITEAYNDVDLQWLLYGKGSFPKSENNVEEKKVIIEPQVASIPIPPSAESSKQDLFSQSSGSEKENIETQRETVAQIMSTTSEKNEIDRIVIFYSNGTFNSYQMKKS